MGHNLIYIFKKITLADVWEKMDSVGQECIQGMIVGDRSGMVV